MAKLGKLERLQLKNYKSIKQLDIRLGKLNILLGQNGAGKSNFIHFFKMMHKLRMRDLQFHVGSQGVDRLLHFGRKISQEIDIQLEFSDSRYNATLVPTPDERLIFKSEYAQILADEANDSYAKIDLAMPGDSESNLPTCDVARYIDDWQIYHFHDTSDTALVKNPCNINDNDKLQPKAENLAAFLYSIKETNAYGKIVNTIQRVAPFFQDFILQPDKLNPQRIRLRWKHQGSDDYFDAHSLSDGTLRFICLTTLLLQPELPTIILLDEPELGLHPYATQLLAGLIKSASAHSQVIASTQSVTLTNEFGWQDIIVVQQNNNTSEFKRLQREAIEMWLEAYEMGDIWQKNLIGGTPTC